MGLTVKRVERLLRAGVPGKYTDGDVKGLMLCVESKSSAHWLLRYQRDHKVRHLGLGGARDVPLASARAKARRERERIADGIDPLSVKRAERAAQRQAEARLLTFRQAAERCHAAREAGWSSAAHAAEFLSSLERWVYPHIGSLDVAAVGKDEVLRVLEQKLHNRMGKAESGGTFWTTKTITADRVRSRVHTVLDWAEARGYRAAGTPNPARWKGFLDQLLAGQCLDHSGLGDTTDRRDRGGPAAQAPRKIAPVKNMARERRRERGKADWLGAEAHPVLG
jgi:Arm DNA-binding domain